MPKRVPTYRPPWMGTPQQSKRDSDRLYNRTRRDKEAQGFYESPPWRKLRAIKLASNPLCEPCQREGRLVEARFVHHVRERSTHPELALVLENLESICASCHSRHHARRKGRGTP